MVFLKLRKAAPIYYPLPSTFLGLVFELSEDEEVLLRSQFATLKGKGKRIEEHLAEHNEQFRVVFGAIKQLLSEEEKPKKRIGV